MHSDLALCWCQPAVGVGGVSKPSTPFPVGQSVRIRENNIEGKVLCSITAGNATVYVRVKYIGEDGWEKVGNFTPIELEVVGEGKAHG